MPDCRVVRRIISEADDFDLAAFPPEIRRHIGSCESCSRYWREMASVDAAFTEYLVPGSGVSLLSVASRRAEAAFRANLRKAVLFLLAALALLAWSVHFNSNRLEWAPLGSHDTAVETCTGD